MDANLNKEQEELLALQEKGFFKELNAAEQLFVLNQTTQESFDQAHFVLMNSKDLYLVPEARPLILPVAKANLFRRIVVPFVSSAAAAIITFFFFPKETVVVQKVDKPIYLTADTVYLHEKTVDTVIEYREGQTIYVYEKSSPHIDLSERVKSKEVLPALSTLNLKNKGESMKEDKLVGLMDGVKY